MVLNSMIRAVWGKNSYLVVTPTHYGVFNTKVAFCCYNQVFGWQLIPKHRNLYLQTEIKWVTV